ncbi:TetR/AcrR family transcriptional regulator [Curtobacterium sp. VKM Ac-2865]|uniref:TetR/AcrR family transcriptional regulator n=1 Tax=Curtobacterium sp. VKM Ac-2865 TaxID=2783817 RepID=UPI00188B50F3|nr:TetR/AcrR family transcriptional regulator [Curtobacterium sp. VKM Ac-2865]MBF4582226.1 TetR/AcrR family transcriptional regulator [Curtobacterium sp. VKM Ac-2865]
MSIATTERDTVRARIVDVASELLAAGGPHAVTTRAVAAAAGVQAPTIYRQFGDKDGLLEAVADQVFSAYVAGKTVPDDVDPIEHLRDSFDAHVTFGLANPGLIALLSDPLRPRSEAEDRGIAVLRERVHRVALAGRLRVPEARAVSLVHAIGVGLVLALLGAPVDERDPALTDAAWDALASAILTDDTAPADDAGAAGATRAAAVRLTADDHALAVLSPAERGLLRDWLARIAAD